MTTEEILTPEFVAALDALPSVDADARFSTLKNGAIQAGKTKRAIIHAAFSWYEAVQAGGEGAAEREALFALCSDRMALAAEDGVRDAVDAAQIIYFAGRKAREKAANIEKDRRLKEEAAARKRRLGIVALDHGERPVAPRRPDLPLPPIPPGAVPIRETPAQARANDQLRSGGGLVQVNTGNVEYRLREQRWRDRSDRFRKAGEE